MRIFGAQSGKLSFSQNSMLNLGTQVGMSVLAVIALPTVVHGLGDERFGLLSLCWLMLGYVGFLDMGLGQATVNIVSASISAGRIAAAGRMLRTSLAIGAGLSLGFIALFEIFFAAGLAEFLNLSPAVLEDAKLGMHVFALGIPPVLLMGILRSVPLSMNRFDLVNLVQAFGAVLQWLGSIAVIAAGGGLVEVIILFVVTRYLLAGVLYLYFRHVFSRSAGTEENAPPAGDGTSPIRKLLAFGGWMSVAQLVGPILLLLERVIISRTSSPEWITYFVVPQDTLLKLVIIPMSLASTLYSIVSARWGTPGGVTFSKNLYDDAVRYSWYVLIPVVFIGAVFSEEILRLWLGETFAARSGGVFTVIVCGVLFHGLAQLPNVVIIGSGKPRVPAGLLLVEFLPYLALCVWFTSLWGVLGTALAWFARVVVETLYLFIRARGLWGDGETGTGYAFLWKGPVLLACCGLPVLALKSAGMGTAVSALTLALFLLAYGVALWFVVFEGEDRRRMLAVFRPAGS